MKLRTHKLDSRIIVYDADIIEQADGGLFDVEAWKRSECLVGLAEGRGNALLLQTTFGAAVLRPYLRGGWAAGFSRDRYLFTGFKRSRPVAEFNLLARLSSLGLPVPEPLAAQCIREGIFYRGSLMTRRIMDAEPMADVLQHDSADRGIWRATGKCIRRFHDHGVIHADLNARNILIQASGTVYLIDFDRARMRQNAKSGFLTNLKRLRRSLLKFWPADQQERLDEYWGILLEAYAEDPGGEA